MSLFQWFVRKPHPERGTVPVEAAKGVAKDSEQRREANKPSERSARREQLYTVVRDAMMRVGILSAGYKFKVLSLDSGGQRFVVMVDLAQAYAAEPARLREIEYLIAELAKSRMEATVSAVYWRISDLSNVSAQPEQAIKAKAAVQAQQAAPHSSAPIPVEIAMRRKLALSAAAASNAKSFEPIDSLEMDAFKQAVAAAQGGAEPPTPHTPHVRRSGPLLGPGTTSEERLDFAASGMGSLGVTQYGELR